MSGGPPSLIVISALWCGICFYMSEKCAHTIFKELFPETFFPEGVTSLSGRFGAGWYCREL
ncbi:hypothetical protein PC116_g6151 [Phytophthora cactorum]|nr:hypothetical protein PC116_g6151 [Phytophthora cactorum]